MKKLSRMVRRMHYRTKWRVKSGIEIPQGRVQVEAARSIARNLLLESARKVVRKRFHGSRREVACALRRHVELYRACKEVKALDPSWSRFPVKFLLQISEKDPSIPLGFALPRVPSRRFS